MKELLPKPDRSTLMRLFVFVGAILAYADPVLHLALCRGLANVG
ncbi:MAG: hypothetical protein Q4G22_05880 [Paracoccus sp. (in: a-proteobacteria)]|nr:hypothetical protein [Paracoccus sp. (in: a-proteobacteria)]MDO5631353.1 hypothetical protein [Paracoccus sp. (in: a-proteobacteria)]